MMKIKFDVNLMKTISLFEKITRANVKDCIEQGNRLVFIVEKGEMAKAIGPKGKNIHRLEKMLNRKIKIVEYSDDLLEFTRNVISPIKPANIAEEDGTVTMVPEDSTSRGLLIGRGAVNLRGFEDIIKRYFPIKELKVV